MALPTDPYPESILKEFPHEKVESHATLQKFLL